MVALRIASHVVGDGPIDILYVQGAWAHLEVERELPAFRPFCERIGTRLRVRTSAMTTKLAPTPTADRRRRAPR